MAHCAKFAHMEIGARVAEARSERGATQAQLAATIGMDRTALAKIESGSRGVSALELVAIARALGRRVEWFVDETPPALASYRGAHPGVAVQAIDTELDSLVREVEFVTSHCPELVTGQPEPLPHPATPEDAEDLAATAQPASRAEAGATGTRTLETGRRHRTVGVQRGPRGRCGQPARFC